MASGAPRAAELDPIVELYGPGGGLVSRADDTFEGQAEALGINLGVGRHTVRVTNYMASAGPGPYTVQAALGAPLPSARASRQDVFGANASEQAVAVADFNADGRDDVAMASGSASDVANQHKLFVFTQGADGTLGSPVRIATHAGSPLNGDPLRAVDLDGDGDTDVVRGTASGVDVAWNDGGVLTARCCTRPVGPSAGSRSPTWTARARRARRAGRRGLGPPVGGRRCRGRAGRPLGACDVERHRLRRRRPDRGRPSRHRHARGHRRGDPRRARRVMGRTGDRRPARSRHVGSLEGARHARPGRGRPRRHRRDQRMDAGSWGEAGARLAYTTQQPDASFGPLTMLATQGGGPGALKIGDVTADGRADVAVLHNGGDVGVFRQTAAGTLAAEHPMDGASATTFFSPDSLGVGDLDGDGVSDLAVAGYNVGLSLFTHQAAAAVEGAGPWVAATSPAEHATGVATTVRPSVTFGRDVAPSSVNANTVALIDGRDGHVVPTTLARSGRTVTLTPAARLQSRTSSGSPASPIPPVRSSPTSRSRSRPSARRRPATTSPGPSGPSASTSTATASTTSSGTRGRCGRLDLVPRHRRPRRREHAGDRHLHAARRRLRRQRLRRRLLVRAGIGHRRDVAELAGIRSEVVPVLGVYVPLVGDFDRNGFDDIFWYGPGTGPDSAWYFGPTGRRGVAQSVTGSSYRPAAGDFNRDGYDDIVWYTPGSGPESLWRGRASGFAKGSTMSITGTYAPSRSTTTQTGSRRCSCTRPGHLLEVRHVGLHVGAERTVASVGRPARGGRLHGRCARRPARLRPGSPTDPLYRGTSSGVG